jgi:hypothetical protein
VGSQEETLLSLLACDVQNVALNQSSTQGDRGSSGPTSSLMSGSCSGVKLCPGGSYCELSSEGNAVGRMGYDCKGEASTV